MAKTIGGGIEGLPLQNVGEPVTQQLYEELYVPGMTEQMYIPGDLMM